MNKLLQLKALENEVKDILINIQNKDVFITYHSHYEKPTLSLYTSTTSEETVLEIDSITYKISNDLSISTALKTIDDIRSKLCLN